MTIQTRLILALTALALALVLGIVLLFQWRFDAGMADYLNAQQKLRLELLAEELAERWHEDPGWTALREDPRKFFRLARRLPGSETAPHDDRVQSASHHAPHHENAPEPVVGPPPPMPVLLLDRDERILIARARDAKLLLQRPEPLAMKVAVQVDGETVGYVGSPPLAQIENEIDRHFREAQLRSLWVVSGFALLVAVMMAVLLARHFTQPLRRLSLAAHRLTQQQYDLDVDDTRRDEFGILARDVRELAKTLAQNADARQRWFADISHELRTPLAVLLGEIDALVDGVRPLTPERIASLQQEVQHLQRLVEDLYVLARADLGALQYQKAEIDLGALIRERVESAKNACHAAGLAVTLNAPAQGPGIYGDADRLQQLVDNLLANSLRYTARGGDVRVMVNASERDALLVIEDSAPGVPEAALPRLFEHLFRVDDARTRSQGGAGLGLAICRRIVDAHSGTIAASNSVLGGLCITVTLPLSATTPQSASSQRSEEKS